MRPRRNATTYDKNEVAFDQIGGGERDEGAITDHTTRRGDHREEGRQNGLGLLELVELDERVQERHTNQDAAEIGVCEVILGARPQGHRTLTVSRPAHLEVNAEENVLQDTGDD